MIDGCKNTHENSSTAKVSKHIPSGFSMSIILKAQENRTMHTKVKTVWKGLVNS